MTHLAVSAHVQLSKALCNVQLAWLPHSSCLAMVRILSSNCSLDLRESFSSLGLHTQLHSSVRLWIALWGQEAPS